MIFKRIFNCFLSAVDDVVESIKLGAKILGGFYTFILALAGLIGLFTDDFSYLKSYGFTGLIFLIISPVILILLIFANAYLIKKKLKIQKWFRISVNCLIILLVIISAVWIHHFKRSSLVFFISEGYIYSATLYNSKSQEVYSGKPSCLTQNCLETFEGKISTDPFESLPNALFKIPNRMPFGEYTLQVIFGRDSYLDTLYKELTLNMGQDTIWIRLNYYKIIGAAL